MLKIISSSFKLEEPLDEKTFFQKIMQCEQLPEAEREIRGVLEYLHPRSISETYAIFDIIYQSLRKNLEAPLKVQIDLKIKEEKKKMLEELNQRMEFITSSIMEQIQAQSIPQYQETHFDSFGRNLGFDNLNCILKFQREKGCKMKQLSEIKSQNFREFICMTNVNNKFIAFGTREGFVEVYRLRDQQMIALFGKHQDSVNFITNVSFFNKTSQKYEKFIVSSGQSDRKIIVWDIETQKPLCELCGHDSVITTIVDLQDGTHLASASLDGTIIVWNLDT